MNSWLDAQVKHEQQQDWLRAAERRRLVNEARTGHAQAPALAGLVHRLAMWRHSLKARNWTLAARPH